MSSSSVASSTVSNRCTGRATCNSSGSPILRTGRIAIGSIAWRIVGESGQYSIGKDFADSTGFESLSPTRHLRHSMSASSRPSPGRRRIDPPRATEAAGQARWQAGVAHRGDECRCPGRQRGDRRGRRACARDDASVGALARVGDREPFLGRRHELVAALRRRLAPARLRCRAGAARRPGRRERGRSQAAGRGVERRGEPDRRERLRSTGRRAGDLSAPVLLRAQPSCAAIAVRVRSWNATAIAWCACRWRTPRSISTRRKISLP